MSKTHRAKKTTKKSWLFSDKFFVGLMLLGMVVVFLAGYKRRIYDKSLSLPEGLYGDMAVLSAGQGDFDKVPVEISIEGSLELPVEAAAVTSGDWAVSETGASYLLDSARLGESGNVILYGHNSNELLGNLRDVEVGNEISLKGMDGNIYKYQVESVQAVNPDEVGLLQPTEEAVVTAYTCTGFLDSKRWVVRARLVDSSQ